MHVSLAYAEAAHSYEYLKPDTNLSDDNKLNGTKSLVLNGKNASKLIVSCIKNDEFNLVLVDTSADGVSFNSFKTIDEQTCAEFTFENVSVDEGDVIASADEASNLLVEVLNLATLCVSAEAVGCMLSCYKKQFNTLKNESNLINQYQTFRFYNIAWLICLLIVSLPNHCFLKPCLKLIQILKININMFLH